MKFLIIGAGAWGTSMAVCLKKVGHQVSLLCRNDADKKALQQSTENKAHLPGVSIEGISLLSPYEQPFTADAVFVALPSHAFESVLKPLQIYSSIYISLAKGVVLETLTTPCETLEHLLPRGTEVFCLSGPTHAGSVAAGLPCGMALSDNGHGHAKSLEKLQEAISLTNNIRVYAGHDRRGAELGGALKNSYAVAAGICDGLRLGDNAKAGLLTRSLSEMSRLGHALGGKSETFYGLTGIGDLMATSYGQWSRNRQLGERVAHGEDPAQLVEKGLTAEGYRASKGLLELAHKKKIEAPILEQVAAVLHANKSPKTALQELMSRPLKKE